MKQAKVILEKGDKIFVYVNTDKRKNNFEIRHRLNVKEVLYGCFFLSYHPEMHFTNAINAGYKILVDNRLHNSIS